MEKQLLQDDISFTAVVNQYDARLRSIIGERTFQEDQVWEIITLLHKGTLHTGSDGSEKDGRGSHAYGFTNGRKEGNIWGGTQPSHLDQHMSCPPYG